MSETSKQLLLHYTSFEALTSIFNNPATPSMRATHIDFLNDTSEYDYGIEKVLEYLVPYENDFAIQLDVPRKIARLERLYKRAKRKGLKNVLTIDELNSATSSKDPKLLEKLIEQYIKLDYQHLRKDSRPKAYTFSLSKAEDSLYQWQMYCPHEGGIALGFDTDTRLYTDLIDSTGSFYLKHYADIEKVDYPEKSEKIKPFRLPNKLDYLRYLEEIEKKALLLKHPAFAQEQEYRVIFNMNFGTDIKAKNRGYTTNKPYIELNFKPANLKRIFVSPKGDQEHTRKLLIYFIQDIPELQHLSESDIVISDIPFRS
ncbi:DUF2971 domain-containing protein [Agarivorans sp. B2Z047]|uniref:DUF2971 domain-containing protein n=1 Tax=Agarivorans sp. B2Z047 TaxID=2652721 RepID=UPI00128DA7DA|nr:DUF2971 domain-containing protein [Agarivorans sp. B2Z047]MPW30109.1 DUF2971 domain-containing protein [Agarivorans sp. B2Z047]UQN43257.1 DUF2971 domain-containing protein [Agarivorans sp. B2Z047]